MTTLWLYYFIKWSRPSACQLFHFSFRLSALLFVVSHLQDAIVHQDRQELSLGVTEVEARVETTVLNHGIIVENCCHFLVLQLAQVDLAAQDCHLNLPTLSVLADATVLALGVALSISQCCLWSIRHEDLVHFYVWLTECIEQSFSLDSAGFLEQSRWIT